MPKLTDPRRETACQSRASGKTIVEAYAIAGYTGKGSAAVKFFQRAEIAKRVDEIIEHRYESERKSRDIATKKAGLEEAWIIERLMYGIEISLRGEPMVDATGKPTGIFGKRNLNAFAKLIAVASDIRGLRVHRVEVGNPGDFSRMSDEDLDKALLEQGQALGIDVRPLLELKANPPVEE